MVCNSEVLDAPREDTATGDTPVSNPISHGADWIELVNKIRADDTAGMEELYRVFSRGVRFYFCRQLGPQDLDDKVHDTFLIVVQAVKRGNYGSPSA